MKKEKYQCFFIIFDLILTNIQINFTMTKYLLIFTLLIATIAVTAQPKVDSLVMRGIKLHDLEEYDEALQYYNKALKINPNSDLALYEISYTYMQKGDYQKAILYSNQVLKLKRDHLLEASVVKGSAQDYLGDTKGSIKTYKKAIKKYEDHYLLRYNLGFTYYRLNEYDKAEQELINAINLNPGHGTSHLVLGFLMEEQGRNIESLLSLHYFLYLEPFTKRSMEAYHTLSRIMGIGATQNENDPTRIVINLNLNDLKSEFGLANMTLTTIAASKFLEENVNKSDQELFIENTESIFTILGELKTDKNKGIYWEQYIPFFYEIAKSDHIDTYCYYIMQYIDNESFIWIEDHPDRLNAFDIWLRAE